MLRCWGVRLRALPFVIVCSLLACSSTERRSAVQKLQIDHCSDKVEECPAVGACDPESEYATPRWVEGKCVAELPERRRPAG